MAHRVLGGRFDQGLRLGGMQADRRVASDPLFDRHRAHALAEDRLGLLRAGHVAGHQQHGHAQGPCQGGVEADLADGHVVEPHVLDADRRVRVGEHATVAACHGVIGDHKHALSALIQAQQTPWARPTQQDAHLWVKLIVDQVQPPTVTVVDNDVRRASVQRPLHGGIDLGSDHTPRKVILLAGGQSHSCLAHHRSRALKVGQNIDLHSILPVNVIDGEMNGRYRW